MTNVSDGTYSAAYSYLANSPLISQINFRQSTTSRMTTTKTYDNLNRLTQISSVPTGSNQPSPSIIGTTTPTSVSTSRSRMARIGSTIMTRLDR